MLRFNVNREVVLLISLPLYNRISFTKSEKNFSLQESLADESFSTSDGAAGPSSISSSPSRAMLDRPTQLVRIVTSDFPQYFAVITRARQDITTVGAEGGTISSTLCPRAKVHIPQK